MSKYDRFLTSFATFLVRHWLTVINVLVLIFIIPAILLYPLFMYTGNPALVAIAGAIKSAYGPPICHQLPSRSIFIFGHQMAMCSRNFAIFTSFLFGGILFYFLRNKLKPFNIVYFLLICIPMAIDGFSQLFGVPIPRDIGPGLHFVWTTVSNNELRIITGSIFGFGSALFLLPYLQEIFKSETDIVKK